MNFRDLEYLIALDQHGHFGKAAQECHVSQPTLSGQFKKLEQELGVLLLDRKAKGVVLSEAGKAILERAKRITAELNQIHEIGRFHQNPRAGSLRIGVIPTVGPYLLPHCLKNLRKGFPEMKYYFHEMKTNEIIHALHERRIDLGLLALSVHEERLEEKVIYKESFYLAVPKGHQGGKALPVNEKWLLNEQLLLLEEGHCLRDQALKLCQDRRMSEMTNFRASSIETLRAMIEIGEGVTPVPELIALAWMQQAAEIDLLPFSTPVPQREIGLIYAKHSIRRELFNELADIIATSVATLIKKTSKRSITLPVY